MVSNNVELNDQESSLVEPRNQTPSITISRFLAVLALSIWILSTAVSGLILLMLMTGMLNRAIPRKVRRDEWEEVNNQILTALSTLMCLYHHPKVMRHSRKLLRWRPEDANALQKVYCKKGSCRPHERVHMAVTVILLQLNFLAQYASCGLYWGYNRRDRPTLWVRISTGVMIFLSVAAVAYVFLSPLRREYGKKKTDEEMQSEEPRTEEPRALILVSFLRRNYTI